MFDSVNPVCRALMVGAMIGVAACSGCQSPIRAKKGESPESIFSAFSPPTPAEAAAWAADGYDADKRYRGTLLLANAPWGGERVYIELYERAIADEDPSVRGAAVRGLALHGGPEHVPAIAKLLDDPDRLLRWESARALQRLHNPEAVPALIKRLEERTEPESMVRSSSAEALGQYAEPRVLDALIATLPDRDLTVHQSARRSLRTLTGQDLGTDLRSWVAWRKRTTELFAARQPYVYPVFERDRNLVEILVPIFEPPNETASTPVGFDMTQRGGTAVAAQTAPEDSSLPDQSTEPAPEQRNN